MAIALAIASVFSCSSGGDSAQHGTPCSACTPGQLFCADQSGTETPVIIVGSSAGDSCSITVNGSPGTITCAPLELCYHGVCYPIEWDAGIKWNGAYCR